MSITVVPASVVVSPTSIAVIPAAVVVMPPLPTVTPSGLTMLQLATAQLTASNFTGGTVTWSTSDATVATVNPSGLVTSQSNPGTTTILATGVANTLQTASCVITVSPSTIAIFGTWNAGPGYTGLTGTVGAEWIDASTGAVVQARATTGVTERAGTGIYNTPFPTATPGRWYIVNWDAGVGSGVYFSQTVYAPTTTSGGGGGGGGGGTFLFLNGGVVAASPAPTATTFSSFSTSLRSRKQGGYVGSQIEFQATTALGEAHRVVTDHVIVFGSTIRHDFRLGTAVGITPVAGPDPGDGFILG